MTEPSRKSLLVRLDNAYNTVIAIVLLGGAVGLLCFVAWKLFLAYQARH